MFPVGVIHGEVTFLAMTNPLAKIMRAGMNLVPFDKDASFKRNPNGFGGLHV